MREQTLDGQINVETVASRDWNEVLSAAATCIQSTWGGRAARQRCTVAGVVGQTKLAHRRSLASTSISQSVDDGDDETE